MTSEDPSSQPAVNSLASVGELLHWLLDAGGHLAAGVVVALVLARVMRARQLRWTWALVGLAFVVIVSPLFAGTAPVLGFGAAGAALLGRRWQREDRESGRDLAQLAASRRGPLDLLVTILRLARLRRRANRAEAGAWFCGDEMIVGRDGENRLVTVPFGGSGGGTHTLLLGATGSGKTVSQSWLATCAIERGMGAVVIDPKGDASLRAALVEVAVRAGRRFIEWGPSGPCIYNPYAHGGDTALADKLLAGERFTEPHYLRQAQRYMGHAVRALRASGVEISLAAIVEHLDPARLELLARRLPEPDARSAHEYLDSLTPRQRVELAGVRDRLAILAESDIGRWLDPEADGAARFDLAEAVQDRAVVYFNLDADSRPLLAQMLGAAIVGDLQATVAALQGQPIPTLVAIDEFSALGVERVVGLFGRARSAGFSLVLGTQELADLRVPGRERVLEQVIGNLSAVIAHRQVLPDSAGLVTSLAGTRGAWRTSRRSDGAVTRTRSAEPLLDPAEVIGLASGWAAVIVLAAPVRARVARIFSPALR
jgi:hypothetical protein